jgi:sugar-specific transcriptional regulator TrmB
MATTIAIRPFFCYNLGMDDLNKLLKSLGLEHHEPEVYLAALRLGTTPASVVGKRCKIPRSTARYTCEQLVEKQLMVVTQKGNTQYFTPENPEKLRKLLEMQQEKIRSRGQQLEGHMQDLKRIFNPYTVMPKMRFFEGVDGIIKLIEDVFSVNVPIYGALSIPEEMHPEISHYVEKSYVPKRKASGNSAWMLFNDNKLTKDYQKKDKEMNRISLIIPYKDFPFDSCLHIYGNKVAFYSYKENDMTGIIVENEYIYNSQMSVFKLAWEHAKKLKSNANYANVKLPV